MLKFITKFKLPGKDKKNLKYLGESDWYQKSKSKNKYELSLSNIDRNQEWTQEIASFIDFILSKKRYKKLIDETDLERSDLIDIYLLMTIATMPNRLPKTGHSKMSLTLVGLSIYQEVDKQLKSLLSSLGANYSDHDQKKFGHKYATDVMTFASHLKRAHVSKYGEVNINEVM